MSFDASSRLRSGRLRFSADFSPTSLAHSYDEEAIMIIQMSSFAIKSLHDIAPPRKQTGDAAILRI
jgi:hypothetical protein